MRQPRNDLLSVRIATNAWRQLGVVPSNVFVRIKAGLYALADNPRSIPQPPLEATARELAGGAVTGLSAGHRTAMPLCFTVDEFVAMYTVDYELRLLTLVEVARRLPETG